MEKRSFKVSRFWPLIVRNQEAQLDIADSQYIALTAREIRLIAERENSESLVFPEKLLCKWGKLRKRKCCAQTQVFEARRAMIAGRISVLEQRAEQLKSQTLGMDALRLSKEAVVKQASFSRKS